MVIMYIVSIRSFFVNIVVYVLEDIIWKSMKKIVGIDYYFVYWVVE